MNILRLSYNLYMYICRSYIYVGIYCKYIVKITIVFERSIIHYINNLQYLQLIIYFYETLIFYFFTRYMFAVNVLRLVYTFLD